MAQPRVSVVIPVHGAEEQFPACMESVLAQDLAAIEIICVDDASPDNCGRIMDEYARRDARVRVLHQKHGGVSVARNAGLDQARGQYVYFLDSDDRISPDFLQSFLDDARRERADLVLFGGMFQDRRPEDVAYAPTCALFLRKRLLRWPELRFPPGVQPAEDSVFSHLCLALAGRVCLGGSGDYVYVQHPGQSHRTIHGNSERVLGQLPRALAFLKEAYDRHKLWRSNFTALCRLLEGVFYQDLFVLTEHGPANRQRFAGIVREFLRPLRPLLTGDLRAALSPGLLEWFEDAKPARNAPQTPCRTPRALVVDILPAEYDRHAGGRATWQFALQLKAAGCRVRFTSLYLRQDSARYFMAMHERGIEVVPPAWHRGSPENWLRADAANFDLALLHRPEVATRLMDIILEECAKPVLYFGHDLHFLRQEREAAASGRALPADAARLKEQELAAYRKATIAMSPSRAEAALLQKDYGLPEVFVPQLFSYPPPCLGPLDTEKRGGLLFVGSAEHEANLSGLRWFLTEVRPLLERQIPGCPVHIAGFGMQPSRFGALAANCMLYDGLTEEALADLYAAGRVFIAPLLFGAGIKGKVLEAMFHGLPVVGTGIAYEGLPGLPASPVQSKEGFAAACAALLRDDALWQEASLRARLIIARHFSEEQAVLFWRSMVKRALSQ